MTPEQLLTLLKEQETDASSFYSSEMAADQASAMDRYHARPYGNEIEGRSQVVSHDVEDTINWMMPKLMRAFMSADELVSVDDGSSDETYDTSCVADYLRHVFFKDNDGEVVIHDFAFDALLQRIGVVRVAWEDPQPKPPRLLEGVSGQVLQRFLSDPEYNVLEHEPVVRTIEGQPYPSFILKVQHTPRMGRAVIEAIPPEEYAYSRRARSAASADYQRWKRHVFLADLLRQFPDARSDLDPDGTLQSAADDKQDVSSDGRQDARFPEESGPALNDSGSTQGRRKVWLIEEEIRVDFDGDGITELRHVKRVGDVILENEAVEHSEFVVWTPIRVSHKMAGRSLTDTMLDLVEIRSVILRNTLDSLSQSLVPRVGVDVSRADDDALQAILDADIGGVIPTKGPPGEVLFPITSPDLSGQGLTMMEYMDQRLEVATGVTRHAQGLRPEAITDTKGGIESLQSAANERIELIGRWLAKGLTEIFERVLHLLAAHQDQPRIVKIKGRPMEVDPRLWSDELKVDVSIGTSMENRAVRLQNLMLVGQKQAEILLQAGPDNPVVGLPEYRATLAMMAETMGFKNPQKFFKEIPSDWQPPEPAPDPKAAEAQAKLQIEQAKAQSSAQLEQKKFEFQAQMEQVKAATDKEIAVIRAENEMAIARMRIAAESDIALQRMNAELELARWKASEDVRTQREANRLKVSASKGNVGEGDHGVRFGGQIG